MKNGLIVIGIAFAVALAYIIGNRLSNEAMAVVVGAMCGISASTTVSIFLFLTARENWERERQNEQPQQKYWRTIQTHSRLNNGNTRNYKLLDNK